MWTVAFLIILGLATGLGAWFFYLWAVKSGQFDDMEGPKYRMLDDEDTVGPKEQPYRKGDEQ